MIVARAFAPSRPAWRNAAKPFDSENSEHGTHVAGIAAGNRGVYPGAARGTISGIAPGAWIGNYKILTIPTPGLGLNGNSPEIAAGIEAAVADGMDVLNLSIGEPETEPTRDIVTAALDAAADAGVVPVISAGNDFDDFGEGSVGSPGSTAKAITAGSVDDRGVRPRRRRLELLVRRPHAEVAADEARRRGPRVEHPLVRPRERGHVDTLLGDEHGRAARERRRRPAPRPQPVLDGAAAAVGARPHRTARHLERGRGAARPASAAAGSTSRAPRRPSSSRARAPSRSASCARPPRRRRRCC